MQKLSPFRAARIGDLVSLGETANPGLKYASQLG
jgi:hypothetical protein